MANHKYIVTINTSEEVMVEANNEFSAEEKAIDMFSYETSCGKKVIATEVCKVITTPKEFQDDIGDISERDFM